MKIMVTIPSLELLAQLLVQGHEVCFVSANAGCRDQVATWFQDKLPIFSTPLQDLATGDYAVCIAKADEALPGVDNNIPRVNFSGEQAELTSVLNALMDLHVIQPPTFNYIKLPNALYEYPALIGMIDGDQVKVTPLESESSIVKIDEPDADGNLRKHALYQSLLGQLICSEDGKPYWNKAIGRLSQLLLADFEFKANDFLKYPQYFAKMYQLIHQGCYQDCIQEDNLPELKNRFERLLNEPLAIISQFLYDFWLHSGYWEAVALTEQFAFDVEGLKKKFHPEAPATLAYPILLTSFPDLPQAVHHCLAYCFTQPWVTCGPPQLRGRKIREEQKTSPRIAQQERGRVGSDRKFTLGILCDEEPLASPILTTGLWRQSAKRRFVPERQHQVARELQEMGGAIVAGPSGTLGRNLFMLAPLVEAGLFSAEDLQAYVMAFWADLILRGHHSYEEVLMIYTQLIEPLASHLDPIRRPQEFYEVLLTADFKKSLSYTRFLERNAGLFDEPLSNTLARTLPK